MNRTTVRRVDGIAEGTPPAIRNSEVSGVPDMSMTLLAHKQSPLIEIRLLKVLTASELTQAQEELQVRT